MHGVIARFALSLVLVTAGSVQAEPQTRADDHHLVVVTIRDAASLDRLLALDLDLAACTALELPVREVEVIAEEGDLARLRAAGLTFRVAIRNLEDTIEKRLAQFQMPLTLTPGLGQGGMGGHYTWAEMNAILDEFAKKHPKICAQKQSLGKSHENRDIWMIKISDNVQTDEDEPEVLFDSLHHAREPLSLTTTLLFMDWLLDGYGKDPEATFLVDHRELYFVPCVNPDGYEYNRSIRPGGGGMWRKNRRDNGGSYGVDLNRNWPTGWSAPYGGNSTSPSSDLYRGPSPLSEPETLALDNFIKSRKFVLGCSCHTYQDILLYPYGYQTAGPANESEYQTISAAATAANGMPYGRTSQILYVAAGGALDHYHEVHGMYGFTPELGKSSEGQFWPTPPLQVDIAQRNQHMFRTFALVAGPAVDFDDVAVREGAGSNANQIVEPGERAVIDLRLTNVGAAATQKNAIVTLRTTDPLVTIVQGRADLGALAKFGAAQRSAALEFAVAAQHQGLSVQLELLLDADGVQRRRELLVPLAPLQRLAFDDFEDDLGFRASSSDTATTGRFERNAPEATSNAGRTYQPGSDHTSGAGTLCWVTEARAGTSAGSYDVDGGHTSFVSPPLDLRHVEVPELRFWLWFSESTLDDPFRVEVSTDGGKVWDPRYERKTHTAAGWEEIRIPNLPSTSAVQLRFWTQDANPSLVEACIDDLELHGLVRPGDGTLLGSAARGTVLRWNLHGAAGAFSLPLLSGAVLNQGIPIPGIEGQLWIDLQGLTVLPVQAFGQSATIALDLPVPAQPALVGVKLAFQQLYVDTQRLRLGNPQSTQIR